MEPHGYYSWASDMSAPGGGCLGHNALPAQPEEEELKLPRQLSPAVLAILLQDLIEYNGIVYRTVPIRTFRGKYIGLYFGSIESTRCENFLMDRLRSFYMVMNHIFECVLVSSDGSDESYTRHTQLTSWPAYPRGDMRATLLMSHFNIQQCPTLIILDANGVVVTAQGVEKVTANATGFPWTEPVIENLWGDSTETEKGLRSVLQELDLPAIDDIPAMQHSIVGLLFGELWCPDTRALMSRLEFLAKHRVGKMAKGMGIALAKKEFVVYFVHCGELEKYSSFLDFTVPFPAVQLEDDYHRQATHHFFNVTENPKLCILSPREGWVLEDGASWLKKDPTGVCFPWQPTHDSRSGATSGFINCLGQLSEEDLSDSLVKGPIFVAFLQNVLTQRQESIATLRAAAAAYITRLNDRGRLGRDEKLDLERNLLHATTAPDGSQVGPGTPMLDTIRRDLSHPSAASMFATASEAGGPASPRRVDSPQLRSLKSPRQGKILWKVLQKAVEKQSQSAGLAPWNNVAEDQHAATRARPMSFFYSTQSDHTTSVLNKFCDCDVKHLQQHQLWRRAMCQVAAKEAHARTEMLDQFSRVSADASGANGTFMQAKAVVKEGQVRGGHGAHGERHTIIGPDGNKLPGIQGVAHELTSDSLHHDDDVDAEDKREEDAKPLTSKYLPKAEYSAINKLTGELLGDNLSSCGTAMIIDLLHGVYYICGSIVDSECIIRFLDAWDQNTLDPFEIRLPNPEEMIKDDEQDAAREMAMYSQHHPGIMPEITPHQSVIPGIVIWIPSRQHSESHMSPDSIFRALLNVAMQRCPREDRVNTYRMFGSDYDDEENEGVFKKFIPSIEKFWIFGLLDHLDGPNTAAETAWSSERPTGSPQAKCKVEPEQAPHAPFLAELYNYVDGLVRSQAASAQGHRKPRTTDRHSPAQPGVQHNDEMLIPSTDLFDVGLQELRFNTEESAVTGNHHVCMRTARSRRALHAAMLDELGYHSLVQYCPPPLFVLLVGDLPPVDLLPWPTVLQATHLHVLGSVPSVCSYRDISPALTVQSWTSWAESACDDRISTMNARHIAVPWA